MAVSLIYRVQVSDLTPRLLAVAFGLATVAVGYAAGTRFYGRRAGLVTAVLLAAMPYLVVVNRQALLDGPMAFFSVVGLWLLAKFASEGRRRALFGAGAALGLAFISKETSVVLIPAAYAFLAADAERACPVPGCRGILRLLRRRGPALSRIAVRRRGVHHRKALPHLAVVPPAQPRVDLLPIRGPARHRRPGDRLRRRHAARDGTGPQLVMARVPPGVLDRCARFLLPTLAGEGVPVPASRSPPHSQCWRAAC